VDGVDRTPTSFASARDSSMPYCAAILAGGVALVRSGAPRSRTKPFGRSGVGMMSFIRRQRWPMIRKLKSGEYRLYSRKINPKTGKRRNLGTFASRAAAEKHERAVQYFKRH
jgi:hypothetical protein